MLEVKNVSKSFGKKKALRQLSLSIHPGEMMGFIGHNGAGKTTTLETISGILPIEEGEVWINGNNLRQDPLTCKKDMAFIPDNPNLYEFLTGMQFIAFVADIYEVPKEERSNRLHRYAERLDMSDKLSQSIQSYSHGMKQKVAILAALIHNPKLFLLDEPFVGLDPKAINVLKTILREKCEEGGAVLFSTHILDVAEKICDKIAVIQNGTLLACGETQNLKGNGSLEAYFLGMERVGND